jgi:putative flippase GtrA
VNFRELAQFARSSRFLKFGFVGGLGYLVDGSVLFLLIHVFGLNPSLATPISIFTAMNFTWWGNRNLTFGDRRAQGAAAIVAEWFRFVLSNSVGMLANLAAREALTNFAPAPLSNPFVAQPFGVLAGLVFNFTLSNRLVFREPPTA